MGWERVQGHQALPAGPDDHIEERWSTMPRSLATSETILRGECYGWTSEFPLDRADSRNLGLVSQPLVHLPL